MKGPSYRYIINFLTLITKSSSDSYSLTFLNSLIFLPIWHYFQGIRQACNESENASNCYIMTVVFLIIHNHIVSCSTSLLLILRYLT